MIFLFHLILIRPIKLRWASCFVPSSKGEFQFNCIKSSNNNINAKFFLSFILLVSKNYIIVDYSTTEFSQFKSGRVTWQYKQQLTNSSPSSIFLLFLIPFALDNHQTNHCVCFLSPKWKTQHNTTSLCVLPAATRIPTTLLLNESP